MLLTGLIGFVGMSAWAQDLQTNENGAYLIGSKADLKAFTELAEYYSKDVVLTADIDDVDFMLCPTGSAYSGTFDGAGHTINVNLTGTTTANALFYNFGGHVKNLTVGGNITAAVKNSATFAFTVWTAGASFDNCVSVAEITSPIGGDASIGGFVGYAKQVVNITNCTFAGKISAPNATGIAGFIGWASGASTITNSVMVGDISEASTADYLCFPHGRTVNTNVWITENDICTEYPDQHFTTPELLKSGEMCYLLNGDQSNINWYQTLGTDDIPVPFPSSKQVYAVGEVRCDGTPLGELTYSNENTSTVPKHNDVDGHCTVCGNIITDHILPNADGYLELRTVADVEWFSSMVNEAHQLTIKGMLMNDIDYQGIENAHTPIGPNTTYKFNGEFDGQGHRIKNMVLDLDQNVVGFFGAVRGGTVIRNLIIDASCSISGNSQVGALIGLVQTDAATPLLVENCVNEAPVTGTGATSGIIGAGTSAYPAIQLVNCLNSGDITGTPATAFCSWINRSGSSVTGCLNTGNIIGADNCGSRFGGALTPLIRYEPGTLTMTNTFDIVPMEESCQGLYQDWVTDNPYEEGELCYLLNGNQQNIAWYQRIGTDPIPVPYYIEGGHVYLNGAKNCDGTPLGTATYSNSETDQIPPHEYKNGFCVNCSAPQDDFAPVEDGFYMLSTPAHLWWFCRQVSEFGHIDWNAKMTADLNMSAFCEQFVPAGSSTHPYRGHFDGQGHQISNLVVTSDVKFFGLFGQLGTGAVIENLLLDESCILYGTDCVALVGGTDQVSGEVILRNLGNKGNVYASGQQAAGIFGGNSGSKTALVIENCFSTGVIEGSTKSAALVAWAGSNGIKVSNCWSCSEVVGNDFENMYLVRHANATLTNCYCVYGTQFPSMPFDDIQSGALCYKLNGDQTSVAWYQNLDNGMVDDCPVPFANGHAQVFPKGKIFCDGSVDETTVVYSNNNQTIIPDHEFEDGFCLVCGTEDTGYTGFLPNIINPDYNSNGNNWEGDALSIANGVAQQSKKAFDSYQLVTDLQPGVYKLRVQGFSRAAALTDEAVYADGLLSDDLLRNSYIYAESDGVRFSRRMMDITAQAQDRKLNGGKDEFELPNQKYVPNSAEAAAVYFAKGKYWNKPLYLAVTADTIRVGIRNSFAQTNNWTVADRWRLEYVGDDDEAYALIAQQIGEEAQDFSEIEAQETLKEEYTSLTESAPGLSDRDEILAASDRTSRLPDSIRISVDAYVAFNQAIQKIMDEWNDRHDLIGDAADRLETYLLEEEEPSDVYPQGTYLYIKTYRDLSPAQLSQELLFAQMLYREAVGESLAAGSDATALIVNANFNADEEWYGWNCEPSGNGSNWNVHSNLGFLDVYPVAAGYNTAFEVSQEIDGLPNGIYELTANAYYRPGADNEGDTEGLDVIPAFLFMNDFDTPVLSIYEDKLDYADAVNGQNCRIDTQNDPDAPHNGEDTGSKDIDTGYGYVPTNAVTASFAFKGGRYLQKAYAVVTDGKLRLGIKNTGNPWHNKNLTMFGGFKLRYQGNDATTIQQILEQYSNRNEKMARQRKYKEYYYYVEHYNNINSLIAQAQSSSNIDEQLSLIGQINEEFKATLRSADIYKQIYDINNFITYIASGLRDEDTMEQMFRIVDELSDALYFGSYSDEEAQAKIDELMENPLVGGVIYVQGDLYDEESPNGEWPYAQTCTLYPLYQNADGLWTGTVTLQDRSRRIKGQQRAGFYFRRLADIYKCSTVNRNFLTPANTHFELSASGGADIQALNGTYDITLNLEDMTVDLKQKDKYNWDNQVFVSGTLVDKQGTTRRWSNTELIGLQHVGNGVYVGAVDLVYDNANPYCSFGILTCRSTDAMTNGSTVARDSWTESRYGSAEQYLELQSGQKVDSLVRGLDRTWRISPAGKYMIEFDMNHSTLTATLLDTKGRGTQTDPYQIAKMEDLRTMQDRLQKGKTTYFKLMNDFDMNGIGWWPLNNTFFGNSYTEGNDKYVELDGNNHIISNFTTLPNDYNVYANGFFAVMSGKVKNIGFYNANVAAGNAEAAGVLAGVLGSDTYIDASGVQLPSSVENSYFVGNVSAGLYGGGVAGSQAGTVQIHNVYANVNVVPGSESSTHEGGLLGLARENLTLTNSYAAGEIRGAQAGGIIGAQENGSNSLYQNLVVWNSSITTDLSEPFGSTDAQKEGVLYFGDTKLNGDAVDGHSQSELCSTVAAWEGWNNDGTIGNGYPILDWQVTRGDYTSLCGFGESGTGVQQVPGKGDMAGAFQADEVVTVFNMAGQVLFRGRAADVDVKSGLYLIKGQHHSMKVSIK